MTHEQFIETIASAVKKYAHDYGIVVYSPIIAQAILESAWGTSELAVNANNYFGLKYRSGRCPSAIGIYHKVGSEQNPDGSYVSSAMKWMKFRNLEEGVKGYFEFINIPNYFNLRGVTDPKAYLENIKKDGYATSLSYVSNLMNVIQKNDLTRFDKEVKLMSNSALVDYTKISPNRTVNPSRKVDTITIHCMAGDMCVESCGNWFAKATTAASSNYGIGSDGRIGLYVEEKDRSWCSSNRDNDMRAITIEVANNGGAPDWPVSDAAYKSLIKLLVDICKRNDIDGLRWRNDPTLVGQPEKQNMTVHRWFAKKACPGNYLMSKMADIAAEVNAQLGYVDKVEEPVKVETNTYARKQFIKDVQAATGSAVDGIAGSETIGNTPTLCMARNKRHKAVKPVQRYLNTIGYDCGDVDGVFGPKTTAAVKRYQEDHDCVSDGIISAKKKTWKCLLGMEV